MSSEKPRLVFTEKAIRRIVVTFDTLTKILLYVGIAWVSYNVAVLHQSDSDRNLVSEAHAAAQTWRKQANDSQRLVVLTLQERLDDLDVIEDMEEQLHSKRGAAVMAHNEDARDRLRGAAK
jgi:hypothetical protein